MKVQTIYALSQHICTIRVNHHTSTHPHDPENTHTHTLTNARTHARTHSHSSSQAHSLAEPLQLPLVLLLEPFRHAATLGLVPVPKRCAVSEANLHTRVRTRSGGVWALNRKRLRSMLSCAGLRLMYR